TCVDGISHLCDARDRPRDGHIRVASARGAINTDSEQSPPSRVVDVIPEERHPVHSIVPEHSEGVEIEAANRVVAYRDIGGSVSRSWIRLDVEGGEADTRGNDIEDRDVLPRGHRDRIAGDV